MLRLAKHALIALTGILFLCLNLFSLSSSIANSMFPSSTRTAAASCQQTLSDMYWFSFISSYPPLNPRISIDPPSSPPSNAPRRVSSSAGFQAHLVKPPAYKQLDLFRAVEKGFRPAAGRVLYIAVRVEATGLPCRRRVQVNHGLAMSIRHAV